MRSYCELAAITGGRLTCAFSVFHTSRFSNRRKGAGVGSGGKSVALPAEALSGATENRRVDTGYFSAVAVVYDNIYYIILCYFTLVFIYYATGGFYMLERRVGGRANRSSGKPYTIKYINTEYAYCDRYYSWRSRVRYYYLYYTGTLLSWRASFPGPVSIFVPWNHGVGTGGNGRRIGVHETCARAISAR